MIKYLVSACCENRSCTFRQTINVIDAISRDAAYRTAGKMNRNSKSRCPECGKEMLFYPDIYDEDDYCEQEDVE